MMTDDWALFKGRNLDVRDKNYARHGKCNSKTSNYCLKTFIFSYRALKKIFCSKNREYCVPPLGYQK